jgi:hypothetical protein
MSFKYCSNVGIPTEQAAMMWEVWASGKHHAAIFLLFATKVRNFGSM